MLVSLDTCRDKSGDSSCINDEKAWLSFDRDCEELVWFCPDENKFVGKSFIFPSGE